VSDPKKERLMAAMNKTGLVVLLILAAAGCSPSAANKPDSDSTASTIPSKSAEQRTGEGKRDPTAESTTAGQSSLDQLREGKSSATSPSSPLKDIYFSFDRYDLEVEARNTLKANADWLKANPSARIEIEGHCDERGTNEYNLALGAKRAQAAKDYLITLGIATERLSTISYGEEIPTCKETNDSCWRQNRRARFVVIPGRAAS
jgi:peptidoglycan-associated lipoprotein